MIHLKQSNGAKGWCATAALMSALTLSGAMAVGLSACSQAGTDADDGEFTGVSLSLMAPPSDAKCYRATFTPATGSAVVKTFAPVTGSTAPTAITGIAAGSYTLGIDAFNVACASLTATTAQTWLGDPASVVLATGLLSPVSVTLHRPAATEVSVDYDTSQQISTSTTPVVALVVVEPNLYVARSSSLERLPTTGGASDVLASFNALRSFAADATAYYYIDATSSDYGPAWVAPGRSKESFNLSAPGAMVPVPGGIVVRASSGLLKLSPTTTMSLDTPASYPSQMVTDGTSAFGNRAFQTASWIEKYPLNGSALSVIFSLGDGSVLGDIGADSSFVYMARRAPPGTPSGVFRVANTGGALQTVALVTAGVPIKLATDGTNVYFLTTLVDNVGQCQSAAISKVPRAGGTVTPLWSRKGVCPTVLALGTSGVFFDVGGNVYRLDK